MRSVRCLIGRHLWSPFRLVRPKLGNAYYDRRCLREGCTINEEVSVREAIFLKPKKYRIPLGQLPVEIRGTEDED
jgi:hypothetical protein